MPTFGQIATHLRLIELNDLIYSYLNNETIKSQIIRTIRKRLFKEGLKKDGKKIKTDTGNPYALKTKILKEQGITYRGLKKITTGVRPTDRVTLLNEGHLYASFHTIVKKNQLEILGNFKDAKYKEGIFKNFRKTFANEDEFFETVMSLTEIEIKLLFNDFFKTILKNI